MEEQTKDNQIAQPFLKWAGGKRQLLPILEKNLPQELLSSEIENYYEPFLGSGAMFFFLIQKFNFKKIFLSDTNTDLILTFKVIQNNVQPLIKELETIQQKYISLEKTARKNFYYAIRAEFNAEKESVNFIQYDSGWIKRASKLIFLNKTCYNGLFRLNSKGEFNTPAGDYKNPKICNKENLINVSKVLKNVSIEVKDFTELPKRYLSNSFVYFDPPYRPLNTTSSFTSYSNNIFSDEDQKKLGNVFSILDGKGAKLMLSNSDPSNTNKNDSFFDDLYSQYKIKRIPAKRYINSKANKRGDINELLIINY